MPRSDAIEFIDQEQVASSPSWEFSMSRKKTIFIAVAYLATGLVSCNRLEETTGKQPASPSTGATGKPGTKTESDVTLLRVPNGGIQPQAITDARGTLHLIYIKGDKP